MCQVCVTIITIKPEREKKQTHKNKVVVLEYRDDTDENFSSLINTIVKYHDYVGRSYYHSLLESNLERHINNIIYVNGTEIHVQLMVFTLYIC